MSHMQMCPHCGDLFASVEHLIPSHVAEGVEVPHEIPCPGSGQYPRNPESDGRPLWNGKSNPHFYRNVKA